MRFCALQLAATGSRLELEVEERRVLHVGQDREEERGHRECPDDVRFPAQAWPGRRATGIAIGLLEEDA